MASMIKMGPKKPARGAAVFKKIAKRASAPKLLPSQVKAQKAETKRETMALGRGVAKPKKAKPAPMPGRAKGVAIPKPGSKPSRGMAPAKPRKAK